MSTATDIPQVQAFDARAAMERWQQTSRDLTCRWLDLCSSAVGRMADAEVQAARAANVPALVPLAESSAAIRRDLTDVYVTTIRGLIDG